MTSRLRTAVPASMLALFCALQLLAPTTAPAEERHAEFLEALRSRLFFDTALEFLDDLAARPNLPEATQRLIPYEKAITLQEFARSSRNPDERLRMLDEAEQLLSDFASKYPGDDRLADANGRRAKILLDKAESEILQTENPANADRVDGLRQRAREYVSEAREVFTTARAQYEKRYESFPKFSTDDSVLAARNEAEYEKVQAWINLALCTFTEARTYPEEDANRTRLLDRAAEQFREIAGEHRLQRAGLYATLWEGKCFEERGQLDVAISLYDKLLEVPEDENPRDVTPATQALRDQALWFKLGCWNKQGLHELVQAKANAEDGWLKNAGRRTDGFNGLGIRLELARAEEQLARATERMADELIASNKEVEARKVRNEAEDQLRTALKRAREVARFATPFQGRAIDLASRLEKEIERGDRAPEDFQAAYFELGDVVADAIPKAMQAVDDAEGPAQQLARKKERDEVLEDAEELARLTVALGRSLADPEKTNPEDVNRAWYYFGYVKYQRNHNWDAAAIGLHLARALRIEDSENARLGAFLAVAAMQQEYDLADPSRNDHEFAMLVNAAGVLEKTWPDDRETNEARMIVAGIYSDRGDPVNAAAWYSRVSESFPDHLEAQVKAGTAFWDAYLRAPSLPSSQRPDAATLDSWRKQAVTNLETGIASAENTIAEEAPDAKRQPLVLGKITLADILIDDGREQRAIDLLLNPPHSVVEAVEIEFGESRPRTGLKSAVYARETYKRLLRGYIGLNETDKARNVMYLLEEISVDSDILDLYRDLGKNLQGEIQRLHELGQTERLTDVRDAFDGFLGKLYDGRDRLPYNTLLWIAESYFGIGTGMGDDTAAAEYFEKAADVYREIDSQATDPEFAPGVDLGGIRLRLSSCLRREGDFAEAERITTLVLASNPRQIDAQREMAAVLVDGAADLADSADANPTEVQEKFRRGLFGGMVVNPKDGTQLQLLGWKAIVGVYESRLAAGELESPAARRELADAKYAYLDGLFDKSLNETTTEQRDRGLRAAVVELNKTARTLGGVVDEQQKLEFQDLNDRVRTELGLAPSTLEWAESIAPKPVAPPPVTKPAEDAVAKTEAADATEDAVAANEPDEGPGTLTVMFFVLLAVGIGVGCFFLMARPRKRQSPSYATTAPEPVFPTARGGDAPSSRRRRPSGSGGERRTERPAGPRRTKRRPPTE